MKQSFLKNIYYGIMLILFFGAAASCDDEAEPIEEPEDLEIADFSFFPEQPTMKDEISLVFSGCNYFQTTSVDAGNSEVVVRKHFNSRLKQPCQLMNDTISIGKLKKGDYLVTLKIIDLNPLKADSVFHSQTQSLTITNK